jgi:hypothetical protein
MTCDTMPTRADIKVLSTILVFAVDKRRNHALYVVAISHDAETKRWAEAWARRAITARRVPGNLNRQFGLI